MVKIVIAGISGCLGSAFIGLADALALAREAVAHSCGGEAPFSVVTASWNGARIVDGFGRSFEVSAALTEISVCDAILTPGFQPDEAGLPPSLSHLGGVAAWMRKQHARGALVCGAGTGAFLLGEAGLLDGRRCTTNWRSIDELKRRYPRADTARGAMLIEDRRVVTAGAPLSWIDVALHCIRVLCGDAAARVAAELTVLDHATGDRAAYRPSGYLSGLDPFLLEAERVVRQAADTPLSTLDLARALSTSERTLHRRLKQASGESPKSFIDRVRVETAQTLLETSGKSVKELAGEAGFVDEASFRRAFRRFKGVSPGAYRALSRARSKAKGHAFAVSKTSELIPVMLTKILDSCVNGVTLADPDQEDVPIVYANREFQRMTGYSLDDIIGHNCRILQGDDRNQEGRAQLREAIAKREPIEVTLRNYRKDGTLFYNRLTIEPLYDANERLIYLLGIQYDATAHVRAEAEIAELKAKLSALSQGEQV
jgi:PAS domain S-box-containing protein